MKIALITLLSILAIFSIQNDWRSGRKWCYNYHYEYDTRGSLFYYVARYWVPAVNWTFEDYLLTMCDDEDISYCSYNTLDYWGMDASGGVRWHEYLFYAKNPNHW